MTHQARIDYGERVQRALQGWFTLMMHRHYNKDYGSERVNQYAFYRRMHKMPAWMALEQINKWDKGDNGPPTNAR